MCVFVFALAIDEADRMMGTLQTFAGLVTFLFVASGDTPKVPYQTRLDLFMLFSFFNVAFMLVVHSVLYYWRECDIEELLAEREAAMKEQLDQLHKHIHPNEFGSHGPNEIELGVTSPSQVERVYVNHEPVNVISSPSKNSSKKVPSPIWRIRHDQWADFTIRKWFWGLHLTRRVDAIIMPFLLIVYSIGSAVILGRSVTPVDLIYTTWNDPDYTLNGTK